LRQLELQVTLEKIGSYSHWHVGMASAYGEMLQLSLFLWKCCVEGQN